MSITRHRHLDRPVSAERELPLGRGPVRLRHPRTAAAIAVAVGVPATAAGLGIGIRYLQKTGLTLETVVGLAVLGCGLTLLGYAAMVAWRSLHSWWRLVLLPAGLVVLGMVFWSAVAVMYAVVPPTALGASTPADEDLAYRDVSLRTSDGVELSAWFIPPRNGAAVVLKHGSGSTRTATIRHAKVLAGHGYGVLMVDARGHGRSGGRGMDIGWYGEKDTTAAVDFLAGQKDVEPAKIGVVGLSMGGEEAIGAAGVDPRIRAVVAEGATGRTGADNEAIRPADYASVLERALDWYTYGLTDLLTPASPPASLNDSIAAATGTDFLLVAAGTVRKEGLAADSMHRTDPRRVEVWTVPDADHMSALGTAPQEWERRVLGFLDEELAPAPLPARG